MADYILALDQGTTSSRAIVFDRAGQPCAMAQQEFTQHYPAPGWVEHDANEIWTSQLATISAVLAKAKIGAADLAAVGITNQRETTVLWERATGNPLARAIVWQDRRTAADCERLRAAGVEAELTRRTGLLLDPYFSGTKLAWLLDQAPGRRQRAERGELCFGTIDSWLAWQLTGGRHHITDATNASRTLLYNLLTGDWDPWLLELLRIPRACLPQIVPSSFQIGASARIGDRDVPLTSMAGDQQSALFGQACFAEGMAKNTYGTGCFLLLNTGSSALASNNRLLTTPTCAARTYALEGSVFVGGAAVQWLRDGLGIISKSSEIESLAASVPDSGGVFFVPAFTGLGSPHWDPHARGILLGLTRGTTRGHIARATLEAIAFQCAELLQAMTRDTHRPLRELRVDGGASQNNLMMQFQADLLGVPVVRPKVTETTALGAAYLAGLAVGFWQSTDELAANWQVDCRFEPQQSPDVMRSRLLRWSQAVERSKAWAAPQS
jgi:glycerol kinase